MRRRAFQAVERDDQRSRVGEVLGVFTELRFSHRGRNMRNKGES